MTAASARDQALDIADRLHVIGPVEVTRFFGGAGLALEARQFGFVMKGDLYLKADDLSRPMFEAMGERARGAEHVTDHLSRPGSVLIVITSHAELRSRPAAWPWRTPGGA